MQEPRRTDVHGPTVEDATTTAFVRDATRTNMTTDTQLFELLQQRRFHVATLLVERPSEPLRTAQSSSTSRR